MDWLKKIFTSKVDLTRVNQIGIALMALGVLAVILAPRISKWLLRDEKGNRAIIVKLAGLIICAAGALIAIIG